MPHMSNKAPFQFFDIHSHLQDVQLDADRAAVILRMKEAGIALVGRLIEPFLPETSAKIAEAVKGNTMPAPLFLRK